METKTEVIARNRATVERFLAGTHSKCLSDVDVIDDTVVKNVVCHGFPGPKISDHGSYKNFFRVFRQSFDDMDWTLHALVADERFVSAHWEIQATFVGDFAGVKADGRRVSFNGSVLYRMSGGLIAETWLQINELSLLSQIGAIPAMAA
jgi:predicted ester cyclase